MSNNNFSDIFNKMIKSVGEVAGKLNEYLEKPVENKPQLLTANKLQELKWMSPRQLASIYQYGKIKTHIDDDPEAFKQLKWMSPSQLEAIFGKEGFN